MAAPFVQRVAEAVDVRLVSGAFLAVWYLGFAALWLTWFASRRLWLGLGAAVLLAGAVALGGVVAAHAWVAHTVAEGVVMADTVKVREFPQPTARVSFEIHSGLKVRIMGESGGFIRIRLPNALEGWAEANEVVGL
ncbi:MAG: hypothetical protein JNG84_06100 [Archangium sp.]|nr:hypothetical protein [Archangium sp.]